METIIHFAEKRSLSFLRYAMALVLLWIGALKFADPTPVVGLLKASFPFLATNSVVYVLGAVEVAAAVMLLLGVATRYVALTLVGLFFGTLAIFVIAPKVTYGESGFPFLSLPGEFLLKDLVLMAASLVMVSFERKTSEK